MPTLVAFHPKKLRGAALKGAYSSQNIDALLDGLFSGSIHSAAFQVLLKHSRPFMVLLTSLLRIWRCCVHQSPQEGQESEHPILMYSTTGAPRTGYVVGPGLAEEI